MRILFCLHHLGAFRSFDNVIRLLCGRGHRVTILHGEEQKSAVMDRALKACKSEVDGCDSGPLLIRRDWGKLANVRELVNCLNYLRPGHPNPHLVKRFAPYVHNPWRKWMRKALKKPTSQKLIASTTTRNFLKRLEKITPCDPGIRQWIRRNEPEVVVGSPLVFPDSRELEYIKAARHFGIPTVGVVLSWDNLTTKGTFHILPDWTVVWNHAIVEEAVTLHDVPRDQIIVSGAPTFDFWFTLGTSVDFTGFAERVGLNPMRPFILYLCSSHFIAQNEHLYVAEFDKALKANPKTKDISLLVRPHPLHASIWRDCKTADLAIWPQTGEWVDVLRAKQDYYDTIFHSQAVVGLNTSAFLEAAILDKPCITVMTDDSKSKQAGLGHFQHLVNGGFLEVATSYSEAASIIAAILNGRDVKRAQRQRFVREFIRPRGIHKSASQIMAELIEAVGARKYFAQ